MRVLILGGRAPAALEFARRLARSGHAVTIGDSVSCRLSTSSRSVTDSVRLPPPRFALAAYARALEQEICARSIELVIPTCEEVFYLSRIRDALPASCDIFAPAFEMLGRLHSKLDFIAMARDCGVPAPETIAVDNLRAARDWAEGRPLVLKPEFSRFGVHVRIYPDGIPDNARPLSPLGRWAAQALCQGREACSYAIAYEGRVQVNVCYVPTYRVRRSSSYYFEPVYLPAVDQQVARMVGHLRYTGQISFDWIIGTDGVPQVLECNPRAISGLHLLPANVDLARLLTGGISIEFEAATARPAMLAPLMLAIGLPCAVASGAIPRWWRDWRQASDVLSAPRDSMPLAGSLLDLGSYLIASLRLGCSMREASTRDIEWDGQSLAV